MSYTRDGVVLDVTSKKLSSLPPLSLTLVELNASLNCLSALPDSFSTLVCLEKVRLSRNLFSSFPLVLCTLPRLKSISLFNNQITSLPSLHLFDLSSRTRITWLDLSNNPVQDSPDVVASFCQAFPRGLVDVSVADMVCEGLYIGNEGCASNHTFLRQCRVSHIVLVCKDHIDDGDDDDDVKRLLVSVNDDPNEDLAAHFERIFTFMDECKVSHKGCSVLVVCNAGVSRSATVCTAYLMHARGMKMKDALAMVQKARPCVCPNEGFMKQLEDFEKKVRERDFFFF